MRDTRAFPVWHHGLGLAVLGLIRRLLRRDALPRSVRASGRYWDVAGVDAGDVRHWLTVPDIVAAVNMRITGDPSVWPLTAFLSLIRDDTPVERALSVGCGTGNLEREVARAGAARAIHGIDVSARSLGEARRLASEAGLERRITYHLADAGGWLRESLDRGYDVIFFHGSLHHIEDLEEVLALSARSLGEGRPGWLFVDEYIGPSRHEWRDHHLEPARRMFTRVPFELRRTPELYPPIAMEDPTEMIRSSEIEAVLRANFEVLHYRPYYGNVLHPLVSGIAGSALDRPEIVALIRDAICYEDELIAAGALQPFFAAFAARPPATR